MRAVATFRSSPATSSRSGCWATIAAAMRLKVTSRSDSAWAGEPLRQHNVP